MSRNIGFLSGVDTNILFVMTGSQAPIGTVVTLSWGSEFATTNASLVGASVWVYDSSNDERVLVTPTLVVAPAALSGTAPPMWMQSIGRTTATSTCPDGMNPSWAIWPNGGTGGYVCDKFVIA